MPTSAPGPLRVPLARWADRQLRHLANLTGSGSIAALDGDTIVGERGSNGRFIINGRASAGPGGSRLMRTRDGGWFALTLLRAEDRELVPALVLGDPVDTSDPDDIARAVALHDCAGLLARGCDLGLPVAAADETPLTPPIEVLAEGSTRKREAGHRPLVVDLSAIWAGPLAGHLLWLAGAEVVKVESPARPDLIRRDDPATFDLINQGKASALADITRERDRAALVELIRRADFVIESSRVRALRHLGIDADALVRDVPGLVWLSVTGHGATGEAANRAGVGNDCSVAAGLSRALADVTGEIGYVGDALPDPLTGITAAIAGWRAYREGKAVRIGLSMTAIAASALAEERAGDPAMLHAELEAWGAAIGQPFPKLPRRPIEVEVRPPGADTARFLPGLAPC